MMNKKSLCIDTPRLSRSRRHGTAFGGLPMVGAGSFLAQRGVTFSVLSLALILFGTTTARAGSAASLMFPLDGTYSVVPFSADGAQGNGPANPADPLQRNDDDYVGPIALPFTFNLYGTDYTELYINNNGNVSFGAGFDTYTSTGFPVSDFPMVAPFWSDVDTRGIASGVAYYKFPDPHTLVVTWDNVGYFGEHDDLLNTFQLAISDGTNAMMGFGNNVCFSYDDMQWTTGDASSGVGGFGGVPATIGVNKGDGVNFFQIGRFDHPGTDYDGSGGAADGIDFMDGKNLCFSVTDITNQPPIAVGFPAGGVITLNAALGESMNELYQFIGPELGDAVTVSLLDPDGALGQGLSALLTNGDPATAALAWAPGVGLIGQSFHLTFDFTDSFGAMSSQSLRINVVGIPEPSTAVLAMLAGGCGLIGWRGRRRRKNSAQ